MSSSCDLSAELLLLLLVHFQGGWAGTRGGVLGPGGGLGVQGLLHLLLGQDLEEAVWHDAAIQVGAPASVLDGGKRRAWAVMGGWIFKHRYDNVLQSFEASVGVDVSKKHSKSMILNLVSISAP